MKPDRAEPVYLTRGTVGHLAWPTGDGSPTVTTLCGITSGRIVKVVSQEQEAMIAELPACLNCARARRVKRIPANVDLF